MLRDLQQGVSDADPASFDVCIAGAGMAGITLAVALAAKGRSVVMLEGGGLEFDERSQSLYRGTNTGRSYFDLDTARLRFLGGTSNHWGGRCRPLDPIDFRVRDYIPMSGWPIDATALQPYQSEVAELVGISDDFSDIELPSPSDRLDRIRFHESTPPLLFGEHYKDTLESNDNISCYLNANVIDIRIDENSGDVTELEVVSYGDTRQVVGFRARWFVLALGGIENVRLMLASRSQIERGIGNGHDLVGRYFSEHFHLLGGYYLATEEAWPFGYAEVDLGITEQWQTTEKIANCSITLTPFQVRSAWKEQIRDLLCYSDLIADFMRSLRPLSYCQGRPGSGGYVRVVGEQVPNRESRITLTDELDALGMPRVALNWQVDEIDRQTLIGAMDAVARYLAKTQYGNVKLADWIIDDQPMPGVDGSSWTGAGWHHMGTTRMASSPENGVVDADLRVYGHDNLFVAGSSVFSTAGHANPSFTILQLTLRLADHLNDLLAT